MSTNKSCNANVSTGFCQKCGVYVGVNKETGEALCLEAMMLDFIDYLDEDEIKLDDDWEDLVHPEDLE